MRLASAGRRGGGTTQPAARGIVSSPVLSQRCASLLPSPDAPGIDIYQNSSVLVYNLGFGSISPSPTEYVPITPGIYTISAKAAGSSQVLTSAKGTLR